MEATSKKPIKKVVSARRLARELKARVNGKPLRAAAAELGCSFQFLGKVLNGDVGPGRDLAAKLGYDEVTLYRPRPAGASTPPPQFKRQGLRRRTDPRQKDIGAEYGTIEVR